MAEEDKDSKTEEPTEKQLQKAAEEGNIPSSQEVKSLIMLASATLAVGAFAPPIMSKLKATLIPFLANAHAFSLDFEAFRMLMATLLGHVALILALPLGLFMVMGIAGSVAQTGLKWTPKKLQPNLSKFNPIQGAKRIFSGKQLLEFVKGVVKLAIVGGMIFMIVVPDIPAILRTPRMSVPATLDMLQDMLLELLIAVIAAMVVIAALDLLYQIWHHRQKLKMTKQQVKDEHKSSQGDPHVKARLAKIRNDRARKRMMMAVPTADVVVTNPTHYAVALSYKMDEMAAPRLVAKKGSTVWRRKSAKWPTNTTYRSSRTRRSPAPCTPRSNWIKRCRPNTTRRWRR